MLQRAVLERQSHLNHDTRHGATESGTVLLGFSLVWVQYFLAVPLFFPCGMGIIFYGIVICFLFVCFVLLLLLKHWNYERLQGF